MLAALLPAIASVGAGVAGWFGQRQANQANERMAREQMAFQERMSSSSAQRGVKDYAAAGLNPALAYDRPASAPAGAMSRVEDAVGKGVSSAMQAKALMQSMDLARKDFDIRQQQSAADLRLKESQAVKNAAEGATAVVQGDALRSQQVLNELTARFRQVDQPFETRSKSAKATMDELSISAARNAADMEKRLGELSPQIKFWLSNARILSQILGGRP